MISQIRFYRVASGRASACGSIEGHPIRGGRLFPWHPCRDEASDLRCFGHIDRRLLAAAALRPLEAL